MQVDSYRHEQIARAGNRCRQTGFWDTPELYVESEVLLLAVRVRPKPDAYPYITVDRLHPRGACSFPYKLFHLIEVLVIDGLKIRECLVWDGGFVLYKLETGSVEGVSEINFPHISNGDVLVFRRLQVCLDCARNVVHWKEYEIWLLFRIHLPRL